MGNMVETLKRLATDPNLFIELALNPRVPVRIRFDGSLEHVDGHEYRFVAEADGTEILIDARGTSNITEDDDGTVTISKEAGTLREFIRIGNRFQGR